MTTVPLHPTDDRLAEIREAGRAAARAKLSGGSLPTALGQAMADEVADAVLGAARPVLLRQIERLRAEAAKEERAHLATIDERDHAQDMADQLAYAIAPMEVIGEHSSGNCPWTNAAEEAHALHAKAKEVGKELEDAQMMRDFYQRSAEHLRAQIDAAIAVHERGEHDGLAICLHCSSLSFPPPESGIWSDAAYPCQTLQALGVTDAPTTASEESAR